MFPDKKEYKSDHVILDKNSYAQDLKDFYFCFLELPKFNKDIDELQTMVEKWTYFFKHAAHTNESEVEKITGPDEVIRQAYAVLNQFSWSEVELNTYEQAKKRELDAKAILLQQRIEGDAEGRAKEKAEVAKKMLKKGFGVETIIQLTNLSEQEFFLCKLRSQIEDNDNNDIPMKARVSVFRSPPVNVCVFRLSLHRCP